MVTIAETEVMLEELAAELPETFYNRLNGGIILLPDAKLHESDVGNNLYVLGEYHRSRSLGRYIAIYHGSFMKTHGHLSHDKFKDKLRDTLRHEFTHHLESLAGERGLEIEDDRRIAKYLRKHGRVR